MLSMSCGMPTMKHLLCVISTQRGVRIIHDSWLCRMRHDAWTLHIETHAQTLMRPPPAGARYPINYISRWLGRSSIQTTLAHLELVPNSTGILVSVP